MSEMFLGMNQVGLAHIQAQQRPALHDSQHQDRAIMNLTQIKGIQTKTSPFLTIRIEK